MRDLSPFGARWSIWVVVLLAVAFALGLLFNNATPIGQSRVAAQAKQEQRLACLCELFKPEMNRKTLDTCHLDANLTVADLERRQQSGPSTEYASYCAP